MRSRHILLFVALALAFPSVAAAREPDVPNVRFSTDYERCVAQDNSHAHMENCLQQERDRAENELNATWRAALTRLPPARRLRLRSEERQWIARREQACDAIYQEMNNGNGAGQAEMSCYASYAIQRTTELHRLR